MTFCLGSTVLKLSIDEPCRSLDLSLIDAMALEDLVVESLGLGAKLSGDMIIDYENAIVLLSIFLDVLLNVFLGS